MASAGDGVAWGVGVLAAAVAPSEQALAEGRVRWMRPAVGVGLRQRWALSSATTFTFREQMVGSLLVAEGARFDEDRSATALLPGAGAGARLAHRWGATILWADLGLDVYFRAARARVATDAGPVQVTLPWWQAALALGVSVVIP